MDFSFGQKVKVSGGFYKGKSGQVIAFREDKGNVKYQVRIQGVKPDQWIDEVDLKRQGFGDNVLDSLGM